MKKGIDLSGIKFYPSYAKICRDALDRLPKDYPNLAAMKNIHRHSDLPISSKVYYLKTFEQVNKKIDKYIEDYNKNKGLQT